MTYHSALAVIAASALLVGCFPLEEETSDLTPEDTMTFADPAPEMEPDSSAEESIEVASARKADIDWAAARAEYAGQPLPAETDAFGIASMGSAPSVPVLLPTAPIRAASSDGTPSFKVMPMNDGYYAVFDGEAYDMIINGSDRITPIRADEPGLDPEALRFEETVTGAQVSFKRFGAAYLVEFNCNGRPPGPDLNCVTEDEAIAAVQDLLVAGTQ
ncbi:MAG: hypothetical protein AAGJ84_15490 [Pseudomonadota bacterium]